MSIVSIPESIVRITCCPLPTQINTSEMECSFTTLLHWDSMNHASASSTDAPQLSPTCPIRRRTHFEKAQAIHAIELFNTSNVNLRASGAQDTFIYMQTQADENPFGVHNILANVARTRCWDRDQTFPDVRQDLVTVFLRPIALLLGIRRIDANATQSVDKALSFRSKRCTSFAKPEESNPGQVCLHELLLADSLAHVGVTPHSCSPSFATPV
jgi:hypothetical protein